MIEFSRQHLAKTSVALIGSLLALATIAGPANATSSSKVIEETSAGPAFGQQSLGTEPPTADRDAWKVIKTASLPGFGGSYLDPTGVLHVWTTEPRRLSPQRAMDVLIDAAPGGVTSTSTVTVKVHKADYTLGELKAWNDRLLRRLFNFEGRGLGITWKDIDERTNRIQIGLRNPDRAAELLTISSRLGIPDEAITVVKGAPATPDLRQVRRPLVGGLQIMFELGHRFVCSIGFPAQVGGETGFFTASHCSERPYGGGVGNGYWQPVGDASNPAQNFVGTKHFDPPAFACGSQAPAGCRFSDSLFARRESGVSVSRGFIANASFGVPNWNGSSRYRITDVEPSDPQPGEIRKVGRTTGQTFGEVLDLCRDFLVDRNGGIFGLICQDTASYASAGGDSGSPVFRVTSGSDVQLVGLHWGRTASGGGVAIFSAWVNIEFEFGSVIVCAPGFAC